MPETEKNNQELYLIIENYATDGMLLDYPTYIKKSVDYPRVKRFT